MKEKDVTVKSLTAQDFPAPVRHFWTNVTGDQMFKHMVVLAAIVCYCAYSPRLRVRYVKDLDPKKLNMLMLNLLCICYSGGGKSVVDWVVGIIMRLFIERDSAERQVYCKWKEANRRKAANQKRDEEPMVAIRYLQKFTLPVAVKYCDMMQRKYGEGLPFFLYGSELGAFIENKKASNEFKSVARTAYSLGEAYVRDTLYEAGCNANVDINWCSVLCGQEEALVQYIDKKGVVMGDAGRQILVKIKEELSENGLSIRPLTEQQERDINEAVEHLMAETFTEDDQLQPIHKVDMKWMDKNVEYWCNQQKLVYAKTGSRALKSFYVRASLSAFRIATMLYHLWGEDPSKQKHVRRCYYYFAQFILDGLMAQWGKMYEAERPKEEENTAKEPTLYDVMGKRFTRNELAQEVARRNLGTAPRQFIYLWMTVKKWIYEVEKDVFEKIYT